MKIRCAKLLAIRILFRFRGIGAVHLRKEQIQRLDMVRIGFQLATFIVLLLHGVYAIILYMFNPRQKVFLLFFITLLLVSLSIVIDHDSILLLWFTLNYTWALKIKLLSYLGLSFFMLLLT